MQLYISASLGLKLKSFGNETLLFHSESGDTLLLSPVAVPLVERLQEGSLEKGELYDYLSQVLDYELDEGFSAHLEEVLSGLIKRDIVATQ